MEINDDSIVTTTNTITTITTNLEPDGINTNIYQLSGATVYGVLHPLVREPNFWRLDQCDQDIGKCIGSKCRVLPF